MPVLRRRLTHPDPAGVSGAVLFGTGRSMHRRGARTYTLVPILPEPHQVDLADVAGDPMFPVLYSRSGHITRSYPFVPARVHTVSRTSRPANRRTEDYR
jgi:hypothetical protein